MKKLFTLLVVALVSINVANSQVIDSIGGPDDYGYSWITSDSRIDTTYAPDSTVVLDSTIASVDTTGGLPYDTTYSYTYEDTIVSIQGVPGPTYNWIEISSVGTEVSGFADDAVSSLIPIGFNFPFYWYEIDQFAIGSNGYVQFENVPVNISSSLYGPTMTESFPSMPYSDPQANINNLLAPFLCDLNPSVPSTGAKIYYYTNDRDSLVIQFDRVPFWTRNTPTETQGSNTFQIILSLADSSITYQYKEQSGNWDAAYDDDVNPCVIGMESKAGQAGLTVSPGIKPTNEMVIRFTLEKNNSFSITDLGLEYHKNNLNGAVFGMVGKPTWISVNAANVGDTDINSTVNVTTKIEKFVNGGLASTNIFKPTTGNSTSISSIDAGASSLLSYEEALVPENAINAGEPGTYVISSEIDLLDGNSDNNEVSTELVILDDSRMDSISLHYHDGTFEGEFGFNAGGIYIDLPFYPITLKALTAYIVTDGNAPTGGITFKVFDIDENGGVGAELLSRYVAAGLLAFDPQAPVPTIVDVDDETTSDDDIVINSKGFYISFELEQDVATGNYVIGEDATLPFSLRTFEVQNGSFNAYRAAASGDMMLGAVVDGTNAPLGVEDETKAGISLENAFPNPTTGMTSIRFSLDDAANVNFTLSNVIGQVVENKQLGNLASGTHNLSLDAAQLDSGIYFYSISVGNKRFTKKLIVK